MWYPNNAVRQGLLSLFIDEETEAQRLTSLVKLTPVNHMYLWAAPLVLGTETHIGCIKLYSDWGTTPQASLDIERRGQEGNP